MAYQIFAKSNSRSNSSSPSPRPQARPNNPPIHLPPVQPPTVAKPSSSSVSQDAFPPYPHEIASGYATAHPNITIDTVKTAHIPSLARITGLLLPIRYPNSFYTTTITDPVIASLSRVAVYHDHPVAQAPEPGSSSGTDKVIGGIRCRLEKTDPEQLIDGRDATNLYIHTLHLLSPHRGSGVATSLLNSLLYDSTSTKSPGSVSELVKHYNIRSVTAHVHEANEDALKWYAARGFKLQDGVVEGYYRRLKPSGAKIVRLDIQWHDGELPQSIPIGKRMPEKKDDYRDSSSNDADDEDWEKVEAEDGEEGDLGVQLLSESRVLDKDESEEIPSKKRKAEDEKGNHPHRR